MELIHLSHCVYHCDYHLVIVIKYRKKLFNEGIFEYFKVKLTEITNHYPLIRFKTVNHDKDHLHLLITIPPTISIGKAVGIIKQNTARELKQKFPFLKEVYWGIDAVWSEGYFIIALWGKLFLTVKQMAEWFFQFAIPVRTMLLLCVIT